MEEKTTKELAYQWYKATEMVMALKKIEWADMQALLAETRANLALYHDANLVPKEVVRLFLEMEEFFYFAGVMEDTEVGADFYRFQEVSGQVQVLKESFFESEAAD